ncbi:hypothetical protein SDC9_207364 [bioreactor metagenome]|uniref:Uncharacterized protein n=1 Tax=bioreactor metagenome TaxID=1076179 RepID=A0A645JJ33_9ZZZZ
MHSNLRIKDDATVEDRATHQPDSWSGAAEENRLMRLGIRAH